MVVSSSDCQVHVINTIKYMLLLVSFPFCLAATDPCIENGFRCVSPFQYQVCHRENDTDEPINECPPNTNCNEAPRIVCVPQPKSKLCMVMPRDPCKHDPVPEEMITSPTLEDESDVPTETGSNWDGVPVIDSARGYYTCHSYGNFPDPLHSQYYWFCDVSKSGVGFIPCHKKCPLNHIFCSTVHECVLESFARTARWCGLPNDFVIPTATTPCPMNAVTFPIRTKVEYPILREDDTEEAIPFAVPTTPRTQFLPNPFTCPGVGTYPDTFNCSQYYFCAPRKQKHGHGFSVLQMHKQCPTNKAYNRYLRKCTQRAKGRCNNKQQHKPEPALVFYRFKRRSAQQLRARKLLHMKQVLRDVLRSPETALRRPSRKNVGFRCLAPGRFRDSSSCAHYFLCFEDSSHGGMASMRLKCPAYSYFDADARQCAQDITKECVDTEPE